MNFFISSSKAKRWSLLIFEIQFSMLFYVLFKAPRDGRQSLENKMENPALIDEENIPPVNQDDEEDYDERYDTPNTSKVDETSFTLPDAIKATSTLHLRQKLKRDKIVSLYRYIDVTGDPGLGDLDRFMIKKNLKTGNIELLFLDGNKHCQSLTNKQTGEYLAPKTLREKIW